MQRIFVSATILPLLLLVLLCSSCVKALRPDRAMSSPKIAGETQVKPLLGAIDRDLVGAAVVAPPAASSTPSSALSLSLQEAVLVGLERNASFRVERLQPTISRTAEEVERAAFDPLLTASVSHGHGQQAGLSSLGAQTTNTLTRRTGNVDTTRAGLGLRQATALGTTLELGVDQERDEFDDLSATSKGQSWDLTITQSLLRGRGPDTTLARLRQSRLDTEISLYELQGAAEALVSQIEKGYWDLILAERSLAIYQQSLIIAKDQVDEVKERIKVGALAESEAAAAEAEAASRYQQLVAAEGTRAKARLNLLRLVSLGEGSDWQAPLTLTEAPELPEFAVDGVESHVAVGLGKRPDLNQARLQVQRGTLEVARTKNGLLPKLDLFISLGGSRFTDSFAKEDDRVENQTGYAGGLTLELPFGNREAKALHAAAGWSLDQTSAAVTNLEQLVQVDVRSAYVDVEQALAQVKAADATRLLREKSQGVEQEKFRLGRSTTLLVAQAQRDLVASRIALAEAVVGVRQALVDLYRLEGSLLVHRGIGQ